MYIDLPHEPLQKQDNAYCFNEHQKICEKFKLAFYIFDLNFNVNHYYEPEKRNKNIYPNCMYVIMYNEHVYHLNHNIKRLQQKLDVYLTGDIIQVPSNSYKEDSKERY